MAYEACGHQVQYCVESNPHVARTYRANMQKTHVMQCDATNVAGWASQVRFGLWSASIGIPCHDHATPGWQCGTDGDSGRLLPRTTDMLAAVLHPVVHLECVLGVNITQNRATKRRMLATLAKAG